MPSEDDLTPSQWLWLQCHLLLDDGLQACPHCDAVSQGSFCRSCGKPLGDGPVTCPHCRQPGMGNYCTGCGAVLHSEVEEAILAGTYDWHAWMRSLEPFLKK